MHRRWIVPAAVVLAVATVSTVALASIPDSSGAIHGCRNKATGVLRVIDSDAGQHCLPAEAELTWNQQGPPRTRRNWPRAGRAQREHRHHSTRLRWVPDQ